MVTIAREYGSGGRVIGRLVADSLGMKFYDMTFRSDRYGIEETADMITEIVRRYSFGCLTFSGGGYGNL